MKKVWGMLTTLKKDERGVAALLAAAVIAGILGMTAMTVDVGKMALERARLKNACDAAALAAARELPSADAAERTAMEYLEYNGVSPEEASITVDTVGGRITVEARRRVSHSFGGVLGFESSEVSARSSAVFGAVSGMTGIVPFGIPDQQLEFGREYRLKSAPPDDYSPGNYGALALEFRGAASYENNMKYGYQGMINVGDWVLTEPGNMSGPTEEGVNYRLSRCSHYPKCTVDNYDPNCPMVMMVPVFDPDSLSSGRDQVKIVGFAAFLLKGVEGSGNQNVVSGYFLRIVPQDGLKFTIDPGQTDYGFTASRLVE
ncbi:pilus assembly protein TadG-related protein [Thermosediminibacter litoriperuensis]|uniref:Putative Flp pilus-assembly TadE/G-like protein n=1 Tax=Thermosediminibacter litoriperuensis TaxID=291989 RepID=A0A5S5AR34_9FIRM|nr:pilus assembly protein TadG-related protein [Thermosediminibacter litoriperuensis]TYP53770.1 putative Flp pilus-assembly TadE/G-like protein [Thermosediminibacter litoriperuensis]